jgi:transposase
MSSQSLVLSIPQTRAFSMNARRGSYLKCKFKRIKLKPVKYIGIDEIAIGHTEAGKPSYWTIVRDLDSGSVLYVDQGKDCNALRDFLFRLRKSKAKIEVVAMDMRKAFIHCVKENLPSAQIVFDYFHVIKLMNEKLDLVRRRIAAKMDAEERAILKNQRFILLRNEEDLNAEASAYLAKIKQTFQELADVHMMKEALRSIYVVAQNASQAEDALLRWVKVAQANPIRSTAQNGKDHITTLGWNSRILAFRKYDQCCHGRIQ